MVGFNARRPKPHDYQYAKTWNATGKCNLELALMAMALALIARVPALLAGGLLGLLIYKLQLGLLIPVALPAGSIGAPPRVSRSPLGERDVAYWQILLQQSVETDREP
jgi:hypothetical protein